MKYCSTSDTSLSHTFEQAIFLGPAPDGGLYMPMSFPVLEPSFIECLESKTIVEIGSHIIQPFMDEDKDVVESIIAKAFTFPALVDYLPNGVGILELFHGPTLAFKDFGARFMAQAMAHYRPANMQVNILVATSGDTGGAVASAFSGMDGFKVYILFPKGKVSPLQQKQLTTWDANVKAIEVDGTFDDCQRMVKIAFADKSLRSNKVFGSANSINIARLLPQMVYYFEAYKQARNKNKLNIIVPSGNFGNLTAGLFAKRMGLPISHFVAATNINDVVPSYLKSGQYIPRVSRETLSNAMDVGDPSNFVRMVSMYRGQDEGSTWNNLKQDLSEHVVDDQATLGNIKEVHDQFGYIMDPHTAVAYDATKAHPGNNIVVSTAHWAKFTDTIAMALGFLPGLPKELTALLKKEERLISIGSVYEELLAIIG